MKKLIALVLTMVCVFSIVGCNNTTKDLQKKFPEYYNLDTFKGVEVYVWQTEEGEYRCGALCGTNRGKTFEEISNLAKNSATIEEMRIILASYDIPTEDITIFPIIITSSNYEFVVTDYTKIKDIFWGIDLTCSTAGHIGNTPDLKISNEQAEAIKSIWNNAAWENDVTKTEYDYVFRYGEKEIRYSYEKGIFNDITSNKHLVLSNEIKAQVNAIIYKFVVLPIID